MSFFAYKGRNASGELVRGVMDGLGQFRHCRPAVQSSGITPIEIGAARTARPPASEFPLAAEAATKIRIERSAAVQPPDVHAAESRCSDHAGPWRACRSPRQCDVQGSPASLRENLDRRPPAVGCHAEAERSVFSQFYLAMIYVGETTGQLEEVFLRMFNHLEFQEFMRNQVKAAVRYPSFVVITMAIAIRHHQLFVIPEFAKVYKGFNAELPDLTKCSSDFPDFMVAYWWLLLLACIGAVFCVSHAIRAPSWAAMPGTDSSCAFPSPARSCSRPRWRAFRAACRFPCAAVFPSCRVCHWSRKPWTTPSGAEKVEKMREGVERGDNLVRTARHSGIFTPVVMQMVMVGDESGALDDMMEEIADMYQREVEYELKNAERADRADPHCLPGHPGPDPRAGRVPADLGSGPGGGQTLIRIKGRHSPTGDKSQPDWERSIKTQEAKSGAVILSATHGQTWVDAIVPGMRLAWQA